MSAFERAYNLKMMKMNEKWGFMPLPPIKEGIESVAEGCKLLEKVVVKVNHAKSNDVETRNLRRELNNLLAEMTHLDVPEKVIRREEGRWNLLQNRN